MCDEWMPPIQMKITWEQFLQLPRNPAYKYEYLEETAYLTPRPKHFHGILDFARWQQADAEDLGEEVKVRRFQAQDKESLPGVFAAAFDRVQPFGSLDDNKRQEAARGSLEKTYSGGDGPWIEQASFTAFHAEKKWPLGAILITLLPGGDPLEFESFDWQEKPPPDWQASKLGQPHLTWVFVAPLWMTSGVATALLAESVKALAKMGYQSLWSTFLLGNDSSLLWHWRSGFELVPYPLSRRVVRRELRRRTK